MISSATSSQSKSRGEVNLALIRAFRSERDERKRSRLRNRVLEVNLGLVRRVSSKYANTPQDEDDFFSEGCLALIDAVEMFDPHRGFQFSTYATTCIRNRLFRLFRKRDQRPAEVPLGQASLARDRAPSCSDPHQLDKCRRLAEAVLHQMPAREQELVRLRFGLDGTRHPRSFREVGDKVGLSKERVRQLVNQVILSIQSNLILPPGEQDPEKSSFHERPSI